MGNRRRIIKSMGQPARIAMVDARVAVNGCQVFVGHPDPATATATAKGFRDMLVTAIERSSYANMRDIYSVSVGIQARLSAGEPMLN